MKLWRILIVVMVLLATWISRAQAGGSLLLFGPGVPFAYPTGSPVDVFTDLGTLGPLSKTQADALASAGWASWSAVSTSSFSAIIAGDITLGGVPTDIVAANAGMVIGTYNGGGIHVIYDADGSIMSFLGFPPGVLGIGMPEFTFTGTPVIAESYTVLNGAGVHAFDVDGMSFGGVFTHEFGHTINLAHSQVNGATLFFLTPSGPGGCSLPWAGVPAASHIETMYPFTDVSPGGFGVHTATADHLDDIVSLSNIYPVPGWPGSHGSIAGTVFMPDGITEATGINVVVRNPLDPFAEAVSMLSGEPTHGAGGTDGDYQLNGLTVSESYVVFTHRIIAGGFPTTPMIPFPGPEEFWNGTDESSSPVTDPPCDYLAILTAAEGLITADIIFNSVTSASAQVCYGTTGNADGGNLITIDFETGAGTLIGSTGLGAVQGLAINSIGHMYATALNSTGLSILYRLDAATGAPTPVGNTGVTFLEGIAFDENDVLYGISYSGALVTLSTTTGVASLVGDTSIVGWAGLAADPPTGVLYASMGGFAATPNEIYTIDKSDATWTLLGTTGFSGPTPDIAFDAKGVLYGVRGGGMNANTLFTIDKTTGSGTNVGTIGFVAVSGLATLIEDWLPIQLLYFNGAVMQSGSVLLTWGTLSETNNFGFEVEKSPNDPTAYHVIPNSFVPGHGTTIEPQHYSFLDETATPGRWYYRLKQIDLNGAVHYHDGVVIDVVTGVPMAQLPADYALHQNYPNPFNPATRIAFDLPEQSHVRLEVFDVLGRTVRVIINAEMPPGHHSALVEAADLASGVYLYRLRAGSFTKVRKLVVSK
jgi:hypothetical protein